MLLPSTNETAFGTLPAILRVLYVSETQDSVRWFAECLATDSAVEVQLEQATLESAMSCLREANFDVVVVHHQPQTLDALAAIQPIRSISPDQQAIVVLGTEPVDQMTAVCLEASADAYVCSKTTEVRTLLWELARAAEYQKLLGENRTLRQTSEQHRMRQSQEAVHQLRAQRSLLVDHVTQQAGVDPHPPAWLIEHFRDLLRIHVVTGTGNLSTEVSQLVDRLDQSEVTLGEALMAHTIAVEELVLGLGNRSSWHAIGRGNLLAYELILRMQSEPTTKVT